MPERQRVASRQAIGNIPTLNAKSQKGFGASQRQIGGTMRR
jgi:hypothetical protein